MKLVRNQEGFTIIEVMIVLAIAGLIMVVALIAIPQLQRNQRNNARQSIASRVSTEIGNYAGNNNGRVPTDATELASFESRYLSSDINLEDPQTGTQMPVVYIDPSPAVDEVPASTLGSFSYRDGVSCEGEELRSGSARTYALWTQLEGGAVYCLDNS